MINDAMDRAVYFARALNYTVKMFMKSTPGVSCFNKTISIRH